MKKWIVVSYLLSSISLFGQNVGVERFSLEGVTTKKIRTIEKSTPLKLIGLQAAQVTSTSLLSSASTPPEVRAVCEINGTPVQLSLSEVDKLIEFTPQTTDDLVVYAMLKSSYFDNIAKNGLQTSLRKEIEEDAQEYLSYLYNSNLNVEEPFLQNYIYSLIYKIMPKPYIPFKMGQLQLFIEKSRVIDAAIFPNGTLILTTGLLSALESEDELVAILAREIGHFVFDHGVLNINKQEQRKKRAEFWSAVATGVVAGAEIALASKSSHRSSYYIPGMATLGTAILSSAISTSIVNRLGMEYNQAQEVESDRYAKRVLALLGYNPNGLSRALARIQELEMSQGNYSSYLGSYAPADVQTRIRESGTPAAIVDNSYAYKVSFANSMNGLLDFVEKRFYTAYQYTLRNIENKVATVDDLVVHAASMQLLFDSNQAVNESLLLLDRVLTMEPHNLNAMKYKLLGLIKQKKRAEAATLLKSYQEALLAERTNLNEYQGQQTWEDTFSYLNAEFNWCHAMAIRMTSLF